MIRTRELPAVPLALYAVGAVPVSLRAFVPEAVLDLGLLTLAVGIALARRLVLHPSRLHRVPDAAAFALAAPTAAAVTGHPDPATHPSTPPGEPP